MHNLAYTNNSISYMYSITKIISCNMNTIVYILDRIGQHLSCVGDVGNNATRMSHDSSDTRPSLSWNCSGTTFSQLTKFQGLYQALIRAQVDAAKTAYLSQSLFFPVRSQARFTLHMTAVLFLQLWYPLLTLFSGITDCHMYAFLKLTSRFGNHCAHAFCLAVIPRFREHFVLDGFPFPGSFGGRSYTSSCVRCVFLRQKEIRKPLVQ